MATCPQKLRIVARFDAIQLSEEVLCTEVLRFARALVATWAILGRNISPSREISEICMSHIAKAFGLNCGRVDMSNHIRNTRSLIQTCLPFRFWFMNIFHQGNKQFITVICCAGRIEAVTEVVTDV